MKQIVLIVAYLCLNFSAKALNDKELAKSYIFWVWNRSMPDFLVSQDATEKANVEKKFKKAIDNVLKSQINLGKAVVTYVYSIDIIASNKRVLLVVYKTGTEEWDDVVLCLEKGKDRIIDIGNVENSFTRNSKMVGINYNNKEKLPAIFDKNAITSQMILNEAKTLIRLANKNLIDSFCRRVLYTGGDTEKRKSGAEPCNPYLPKDKIYCNAVMEDLKGYISDQNDITTQYLKSQDKRVSLKIICNNTKNVKEFVFAIVKDKILLSSIY